MGMECQIVWLEFSMLGGNVKAGKHGGPQTTASLQFQAQLTP